MNNLYDRYRGGERGQFYYTVGCGRLGGYPGSPDRPNTPRCASCVRLISKQQQQRQEQQQHPTSSIDNSNSNDNAIALNEKSTTNAKARDIGHGAPLHGPGSRRWGAGPRLCAWRVAVLQSCLASGAERGAGRYTRASGLGVASSDRGAPPADQQPLPAGTDGRGPVRVRRRRSPA